MKEGYILESAVGRSVHSVAHFMETYGRSLTRVLGRRRQAAAERVNKGHTWLVEE